MRVKKRMLFLGALLSLSMGSALSMGMTVSADELKGSDDWAVEFTADKTMDANFTTADMQDVLDNMQPGDSASFGVQLTNSYSSATDWYMTNEVRQSLEDASRTAAGGAYSYLLTYTDEDGTVTTIYDSDTVGGEDYDGSEGLHEASDALEEYFYLDTLQQGESGQVALRISLDGETQGNDYQDTLAQLQMNFAVELPVVTEEHTTTYDEQERTINKYITKTDEDVYITEDGTPTSIITTITDENPPTAVRTGDTTQLTLLLAVAGVLGIMLLALAIYGMRLRKKLKDTTGALLLAGVLALSAFNPLNAQAATGYQYTVRIFAGAQGTFADGSTQLTYTTTSATLDFSDVINGITLNDSSKYYVKGLRESGRDNSELVGSVYEVTRDVDLVVAYGMKAADVSYTVQYLKADTSEELYPTQTYYGNIGDKPVVAFQYIENYVPQAYNLTKTLSATASDNVFTFYYTYNPNGGYRYYVTDGGVKYIDREGETIVTYVPGNVIYQQGETQDLGVTDNGVVYVPSDQTTDTQVNEESQQGTDGKQQGNVTIYGEEQPNNDAQNTDRTDNDAATDGNADVTEETVQEPQSVIDLDDEQTPLSEGSTTDEDSALLLTLAIVIVAVLVLVLGIVLYRTKRKKKQPEEKETQQAEQKHEK